MVSLLKLMSSRNPDNDILSEIAYSGQMDPCQEFSETDAFWTSFGVGGCDDGFVPDKDGLFCYKALPERMTRDDGDENCHDAFDAELMLFENEASILAFAPLFKSGLNGVDR